MGRAKKWSGNAGGCGSILTDLLHRHCMRRSICHFRFKALASPFETRKHDWHHSCHRWRLPPLSAQFFSPSKTTATANSNCSAVNLPPWRLGWFSHGFALHVSCYWVALWYVFEALPAPPSINMQPDAKWKSDFEQFAVYTIYRSIEDAP